MWCFRASSDGLTPPGAGCEVALWGGYTHVVHVKGGKITESWIYGEHQDEVDAFWG